MIKLFLIFAKISIFNFGGGLPMLSLMYQNIEKYGLISLDDFANIVAISQVTPGPIAINAATFVGMNYQGLLGSIVATLGIVIPTFVMIMVASHYTEKYQNTLVVKGIFKGIRPVTIGLIAAAWMFVVKTSFTMEVSKENIIMMVMMVAMVLICQFVKKANPIIIMLLMGAIGAFVF